MNRKILDVSLRLIPTGDGGRRDAVRSGYRGLVRFEGSEIDFGFELTLEAPLDASGIPPGASGMGQLVIWAGEELPALRVGQHLQIREGTRVIGTGNLLDDPS